MQLTYRSGTRADFEAFYHACFPSDRDNEGLKHIVSLEWEVATGNDAAFTMLVEDADRPKAERLVGCAQIVFVTDAYVRWARSGADPRINVQIIQPMPDGSRPLLNLEEVRAANSGPGLNVLTVRWMWADRTLTAEEGRAVQEFMSRAFAGYTRGYRFREILLVCRGEEYRDRTVQSGLRLRCDYAAYYEAHPPAPRVRTYLMGLTRAEAEESEGSHISHLFVYIPPRFYFAAKYQELLQRALNGETDAQIAETECTSLSAVKNWWLRIYGRVEKVQPSFFGDLSGDCLTNGGRGREKRRLLLQYITEHLEELRPVLPPCETE